MNTDRKGYAPMFGVNLHGTGCETVRLSTRTLVTVFTTKS